MANAPTSAELLNNIFSSVETQISDLSSDTSQQTSVDAILQALNNITTLVAPLANNDINTTLKRIIDNTTLVQQHQKTLQDFGPVLGDLDTLQQLLVSKDDKVSSDILTGVISKVNAILNYRPDVTTILGDLTAIKNLKGGPADATAFHDFHVLQIAFKNVWVHAFDQNVKGLAEQAYHQYALLYDEAGVEMPALDDISDIQSLNDFIGAVSTATGTTTDTTGNAGVTVNSLAGGAVVPPPPSLGSRPSALPAPPNEVLQAFPGAATMWYLLSVNQQTAVQSYANTYWTTADATTRSELKDAIENIIKYPQGNATRLTQLILELGKALEEPYAFDVFAPNSYNYGIMLTYRQEWAPQEYQAGNLVASIPLAPGEIRKYSHKQTVKTSIAQKEIDKSSSSRSLQSSETSRAEAEIMQKTVNTTNFKQSTHGNFNIGIGSIDSTTEFSANQQSDSVSNKKDFHEATLKAAEEYKSERTTEVSTSTSIDTEDTSSGEISNPNNEITVTYLFYELQRTYKVSESLHKLQPVILVAQEVPAPHEINEAWLIQYQWVIGRVLLDDSFRPALQYLTSGLAGDEVSVQVIKAHWEDQESLTKNLESQVQSLLKERNGLRDLIVNSTTLEDLNNANNSVTAAFNPVNFFMNPFSGIKKVEDFANNGQSNDILEANRKAAKTRLEYAEQALADMQDKLKQATDAYQKATDQYADALQKQFTRNVAINQLRIHIKQNILYYMQAIWAHEDSDERFFRLYNLPITIPTPQVISSAILATDQQKVQKLELTLAPMTVELNTVELIDIADVDNPLGYKGNYIAFPLKQPTYLTTFMTQEFISEEYGLQDPDPFAELRNFPSIDGPGGAGEHIAGMIANASAQDEKDKLTQLFIDYVNSSPNGADLVIVPTGQLFIEALPGSHPLLEDFKLLHRAFDVSKVKAEVRHAELENLRLATRLVKGQDKNEDNLLEDPDIEKKIIVEGNAAVIAGGV